MQEKLEDGHFIKHEYCIASELKEKGIKRFGNVDFEECGSSDGLAVYEHDVEGGVTYSGFCWSCKQNMDAKHLSQTSLASELGFDTEGVVTERKDFERKEKQQPLKKEQVVDLIKSLGYTDESYRGVRPETYKFFGHLAERGRDGKVKAFYYPETEDLQPYPTGYKIRYLPKYFSKVGKTGLKSDLAGQIKFKDYKHQRDVLIVAGEVDLVSAYQMLRDNQIRKGQEDYNPVAVVSPTTGEASAIKQIQAQYDWLNGFENIILALDNDEVGIEAMLAIAEVLPKEKVKICYWSMKDPNAMLQAGKEKQFLSDFYNAKPLVNNGIMSSTDAMEYVEEELLRPRIDLPEYMIELKKATNGGFLQGRIINIVGDTSTGKSTHVNGMEYFWMFNAPEKTGVVSLEATAGQYSLDMLSLHLGVNLATYGTGEEVLAYLNQEDVKAKCDDLWTDEYGEPRWHILDEREGDIKLLERQMELLVKKHGCKIIIIDVLSDILRGLSNDQQADHMMFQKNMIKNGITIINVLHTRKPPANRDGIPQKSTEYDALGSSTFVQSAAINIVINRNKMAKHPIEKNSTYVDLPKCRGGTTGQAGVWYYDVDTRRVYDRNMFFKEHPEKLPEGYDLTISSFDKEYYEDKDSGLNKKKKKFTPEPDIMEGGVF